MQANLRARVPDKCTDQTRHTIFLLATELPAIEHLPTGNNLLLAAAEGQHPNEGRNEAASDAMLSPAEGSPDTHKWMGAVGILRLEKGDVSGFDWYYCSKHAYPTNHYFIPIYPSYLRKNKYKAKAWEVCSYLVREWWYPSNAGPPHVMPALRVIHGRTVAQRRRENVLPCRREVLGLRPRLNTEFLQPLC